MLSRIPRHSIEPRLNVNRDTSANFYQYLRPRQTHQRILLFKEETPVAWSHKKKKIKSTHHSPLKQATITVPWLWDPRTLDCAFQWDARESKRSCSRLVYVKSRTALCDVTPCFVVSRDALVWRHLMFVTLPCPASVTSFVICDARYLSVWTSQFQGTAADDG